MMYLLSTEAFVGVVSADTALAKLLGVLGAGDVHISVMSVAHYRSAISASGFSAQEKLIHTKNLNDFVYKADIAGTIRDIDLPTVEQYAELRVLNLVNDDGAPVSSEVMLVLATAIRHSLTLITPPRPWMSSLGKLGLKLQEY